LLRLHDLDVRREDTEHLGNVALFEGLIDLPHDLDVRLDGLCLLVAHGHLSLARIVVEQPAGSSLSPGSPSPAQLAFSRAALQARCARASFVLVTFWEPCDRQRPLLAAPLTTSATRVSRIQVAIG